MPHVNDILHELAPLRRVDACIEHGLPLVSPKKGSSVAGVRSGGVDRETKKGRRMTRVTKRAWIIFV